MNLTTDLEQHEFAYLTTTGRSSGEPHRIEIWFVVVDGSVYVIAGAGRKSDWVKNLAADPSLTLEIGDGRCDARASILDRAPLDHPARARLAERYQGWQPGDPLTDWASTGLLVEVRPAGDGDGNGETASGADGGARRSGSGRRGLLGRAASAVSKVAGVQRPDEPWQRAPSGDVGVAGALDGLEPRCRVLHNRAVPDGSVIHHLIVGPDGVFVVDSERFPGRVEVREVDGSPSLFAGGQPRPELGQVLRQQAAAVRAALAPGHPAVSVRPVLCFVEAEMPFAEPMKADGLLVCVLRVLANMARDGDDLSSDDRRAVADVLEQAFPPA